MTVAKQLSQSVIVIKLLLIRNFLLKYSLQDGYQNEKKNTEIDLGLRYESVLYQGNSVNWIALRLSHNFRFKKRTAIRRLHNCTPIFLHPFN